MKLLLLLLILFMTTVDISCHPQCLDYYPPFTSTRPKGLCKETSKYGCCSSAREGYLLSLHKYAVKMREKLEAPPFCDDVLKEILCAECNPYAAHIYDAERPVKNISRFSKQAERFPGLCFDFCVKKFQDCRSVISLMPWRPKFREFLLKSSVRDFCKWAIPDDISYCYPKVNSVSGATFNQTVSENTMTLCVQPVKYNLHNPLVAVHSNDGSHRLFVGEQRGIVHIIDGSGSLLEKPFLNITRKILNSGQGWDERGFLGLVFHPNYAKNGRFFIYYSTAMNRGQNKENDKKAQNRAWYQSPNHKIRISEYIVDPSNPNEADHSSEIVLLEIEEPEPNHEGGMLLFGDDGYLYIFIGDGGGAGDMHGSIGNALNMTTLLGKVLRIDVDVFDGRKYAIPPDNPFLETKNARPEIFAYGLRNTWRCSKDRGGYKTRKNKGRIFCGDVGQDEYEEIDIIVKGGNYGWRGMEGNDCYDEELCRSPILANNIRPILAYNHSVGKSIVGGYVYRGCSNPSMRGLYFYADTVSSRIFAAKEDPKTSEWTSKEILMGNSSICNNAMTGEYARTILSFGEDEAGEMYILSTHWPSASKPFGVLYRLVDPARRADPESCKIKPKKATPLKSAKIRPVNDSITKKENCVDKRKFCKNVLLFPKLCKTFKAITKIFCMRSCGYC